MANARPDVKDADWVKKSFMLSADELEQQDKFWRSYTSADEKWADTKPGGNLAINNPPQYTRFADIRRRGVLQRSASTGGASIDSGFIPTQLGGGFSEPLNLGMGRFYSEQIDDQSQVISMSFGIPKYNGMISFFTGFYDQDASTLANEGRGPIDKILFGVGKVVGILVTLPLWGWIAFFNVINFVLGRTSSKYYYLSPAMGLYWQRVNMVANNIAVNMGLVPRVSTTDQAYKVGTGLLDKAESFLGWEVPTRTAEEPADPADARATAGTNPDVAAYNAEAFQIAPDIFRPGGGVDIYRIACRGTKLYLERQAQLERIVGSATKMGDLRTAMQQAIRPGSFVPDNSQPDPTLERYLERYYKGIYGSTDTQYGALQTPTASTSGAVVDQLKSGTSDAPPATPAPAPAAATTSDGAAPAADTQKAPTDTTAPGLYPKYIPGQSAADGTNNPGILESFAKNANPSDWEADLKEGSAWANFRVEWNGPASETFSSSTRQSDIASSMNGTSGGFRNKLFDFSGGNTGTVIDTVIDSAKALVAGALDGVHLSGLVALAGSAMVDIPEHWESSSASWPSMSYTIHLRTPYGNALSRYLNLYIPLSMLLCAALPLSTGRQSYTSPFLCQLWSRGKVACRLGMITDMTITRGVGNMGFNNLDECLGIDVTFTVKDLSSIMHAPISMDVNPLTPWKIIMDDDSVFKDYMGTLGNLSIADMTYPFRKLQLNLAREGIALDSFFSQSHWSNKFGNGSIGRLLQGVIPYTGLSAGTV